MTFKMPPIKKMKSDSGWADLDTYFSRNDNTISKKKNFKKSSSASDCILSNSNNHEIKLNISSVSNILSRKRDQSNSLAVLLEFCDPKKSADLSISKQKQKEINEWLACKTIEGKARILVLTGPSGCGKTVGLKVLAKENNFDVIEWITPSDSGVAGEGIMSTRQADKFFEFVIRTTRYNSILVNNDECSRRLLLVKDIPNVFYYDVESFREIITRYFEYGREPLIFVCPDTEASRVYQKLFPAELIESRPIDTINVKATTTTAMKALLKRITPILNSKGSHMLRVTQDNIDEVLSNSIGDVRSTILNVIFASLKVPDNKMKSGCESREESLGLLHGVGRVINPKRETSGSSWKFVHNPHDIAAYFQSQATTFLRFLHENYLNTVSRIEHVETAADVLSVSDTISRGWEDSNLIKLNLILAITGVMISNETPVSGWNPVRRPQSEEPKMQRDLGLAEERFYKTIIRPKAARNQQILEDPIEAVDD